MIFVLILALATLSIAGLKRAADTRVLVPVRVRSRQDARRRDDAHL